MLEVIGSRCGLDGRGLGLRRPVGRPLLVPAGDNEGLI